MRWRWWNDRDFFFRVQVQFKGTSSREEGQIVKYTQGDEVERHVGITVLVAWILIQHKDFHTSMKALNTVVFPSVSWTKELWGWFTTYRNTTSISWSTINVRDEMAVHYVSARFIRGYKLDWTEYGHIWTSSSMFESMWMWTLTERNPVNCFTTSLSWSIKVLPRFTKENEYNLILLSLSDGGGKIYKTSKPFLHTYRFIWCSLWKTCQHAH